MIDSEDDSFHSANDSADLSTDVSFCSVDDTLGDILRNTFNNQPATKCAEHT